MTCTLLAMRVAACLSLGCGVLSVTDRHRAWVCACAGQGDGAEPVCHGERGSRWLRRRKLGRPLDGLAVTCLTMLLSLVLASLPPSPPCSALPICSCLPSGTAPASPTYRSLLR